ncbi:uncharacterized protein LOC135395501 [Ornithodoros turicata]|uniref:uncharacterized protein LOC135395501 n=1 Tax=Ornithodoros turicata TaxID=34597 RepID=UPI0031390C4D
MPPAGILSEHTPRSTLLSPSSSPSVINHGASQQPASLPCPEPARREPERLWTTRKTLFLINSYKEEITRVGKKSAHKTKKALWTDLANKLNQEFAEELTAVQVQNRWKSLERAYKNTKKRNNSSGSCRVTFEYEEALHDVLEKQHHITPVVLLGQGKSVVNNVEDDHLVNDEETPVPDVSEGLHKTQQRRRVARKESAAVAIREMTAELRRCNDLREAHHEQRVELFKIFLADIRAMRESPTCTCGHDTRLCAHGQQP